MSEEALNNQENEEITTDSFFGVKHDIVTNKSDDVEVEVVEEESNLPDPEDVKVQKEPEVQTEEVVVSDDDLDKEITDYSERAGKRINQLKYEFHEERRAKEASAKEKDEAVRRLKTLMEENQRLQKFVSTGSQALNQQALQNAQWAKYNAQLQLKKAYDDGNTEELAKAQELLSKATLAEQQAGNYANQVAQYAENQPAPATQQTQGQEQQAPAEQPKDPALEAWSQKNPWFMGTEPAHRDMTAYAMYVDSKLQQSGINPETQSSEYYEAVDKEMRKEFPQFFGVQSEPAVAVEETKVQTAPVSKEASTVVAPVSRTTGKTPRKVQLSAEQVRLARQLGITPEQYANQLLKEN